MVWKMLYPASYHYSKTKISMKHTSYFLQSTLFALLLFGCAHSAGDSANYLAESAPASETKAEKDGQIAADSVSISSGDIQGYFSAEEIISSSAALENKKDTLRKFIRTADLKFRVKDVAKATYSIEDIAMQFGGFVTYTNLNSVITYQTVTPVSKDSSLETIYYRVENNMTVRVPSARLDSALRSLPPLIDYLDYRIIKADDVHLQLLENRLKKQRVSKSEERITDAVDEKGKKLRETTVAEDAILSRQEQADEAMLANLQLKDQIEFSTIQLLIYQRDITRHELIKNEQNVEAYQPGFFTRLADALKTGWNIFEEIVLFFAKSWGALLLIVAFIALFRMFLLRRKGGKQ